MSATHGHASHHFVPFGNQVVLGHISGSCMKEDVESPAENPTKTYGEVLERGLSLISLHRQR
jgi:hypothetical protein